MAICCPKSIKACAMRITRQNECDIALDPLVPNSRIQSAGFMELNLSPDVESGEDITTKNGCGDICIRDKDCDRLKGFEVELKLCGVPLPVIEMLTGATLLSDDQGNFTGAVMRESKDAACEPSKALEFWSKNADKGVCSVDGTTQNLYIHWVLPRVINWEISGGLNFTTGPLEITLMGYAENNPLWFPSYPGVDFPSYVPGGGDPTSVPTGGPPPILPPGVVADPWTLTDQAAIQAGGPLAWKCVGALPDPIDDCGYVPVTAASS
jgi:hypothetical protein